MLYNFEADNFAVSSVFWFSCAVFGIISNELTSVDLAAIEDEHLAKKARHKGEET